ncbi:protein kinase [Streptomyces chattanoogensis]|uniref:protein kinase n=1 Tax=Streptomyces chattanoogensis TaxID=66876 RepID=UPI0036988484
MDEYAGRVLAERYRLPLRHSERPDDVFTETRAFDTYSGQEVLLRQVPLPEVVEAEVVGDPGCHPGGGAPRTATGTADRSPRDPAVRRALDAATAAAQLPDHPLLDQVFDVFAQDGSLWIVGELIPARPLSALLAEGPLSPHRAAEIAADVLTALRALHVHGRLHRNITARTVLVCDDGRAILTGLAVGAAQEALCGYDAVPGHHLAPGGDPAGEPGELPGPRREPAAEAGPGVRLSKTRGASTGLAAERAWQARLQIVGPVTERWAPEQARASTDELPEEEGQSRPTAALGPATDLWAVGALLFRTVQGHAPFPEESAAELTRLVRAQPPAPADACGEDLAPLLASLLRQDPARRPGFEELRGRLRALIRTAPEPEIGRRLVTVPALERGADPRRLPILRRRGELVRRGRRRKDGARRERPAPAAPRPSGSARPVAPVPRPARHPKPPKPLRQPKSPRPARGSARSAGELYDEQQLLVQVGLDTSPRRSRPARDHDGTRAPRGARHLGRLLLALILLLVVGAVAYAMVFLPKSGEEAGGGSSGAGSTGVSGAASGGSPSPTGGRDGGQGQGGSAGRDGGPGGTPAPRPTPPAHLPEGFALRSDPEGFQVAVHKGWQRRGKNGQGQVRYLGGDYELLIVPGRDTTARFGTDPMAYQLDKEGELAPSRASGWSSSSGLRRIDVGRTAMAEGTFTWKDSSGREVYVRNLAMIHNGRYHLVLVMGPSYGRREVDRLYGQATGTYRPK